MSPDEIHQQLAQSDFGKEFEEEGLQTILSFSKAVEFQKDQAVFKEEDSSKELYLVLNGKLAVVKKVEDSSEPFADLVPGSIFGEMAHLEGGKRSATVLASENVTLLAIDLDKMCQDPKAKDTYSKILALLGRKVSASLRKTDQKLIGFLLEKIKHIQAHDQISAVLIYLLIMIAFWFNLFFILKLIPQYQKKIELIFAVISIPLAILGFIFLLKRAKYPLAAYGITFKGGLRSFIEAILLSIPLMFILVVFKWFLITEIPAFQDISLFANEATIKEKIPWMILYVFVATSQEAVIRGGLQTSFENFFKGTARVFLAILFANLIFETFHTVKSVWILFPSFIFGMGWGYLFHRHKTLVGVSFSHAIVGNWAFFVLDFDQILSIVSS